MTAYLLEWANLLGRWVHMITGIAWIGASFYFIWLDNSLEKPKLASDSDKGVSGELWSVHGGGIYHAQKYGVSPETLPDHLHWFKWEAYTTWITGMFMLALMYWYGAEIYLIDPSVADLSKISAIAIGMACIVAGWFGYNALCNSKLGEKENTVAAILFVSLCLIAFVLCQLFSGRGAFMHFGAMLGTIMVGNVFFIIMPGQRALIQAKEAGLAPDPIHGTRAKLRSVHNTYFTLPVLFVMISNHYAVAHSHKLNWLILIAITLIGALVRVYFVARHKGKPSPIPLFVALAVLAAIVTIAAPRAPKVDASSTAQTAVISIDTAFSIVTERCSSCHSNSPTQAGFAQAPKGIAFDSHEDIIRHATTINQQSVLTKAMPLANLTGMTDEERATLGQWYRELD